MARRSASSNNRPRSPRSARAFRSAPTALPSSTRWALASVCARSAPKPGPSPCATTGAALRCSASTSPATPPDQTFLLLHRADLIEALADAARTAGVEIELNRQITAVTETGQGVRLGFADGRTEIASPCDRRRRPAFAPAPRAERRGPAVLHRSGRMARHRPRLGPRRTASRCPHGPRPPYRDLSVAQLQPDQHRRGARAAGLGDGRLVAARRSRRPAPRIPRLLTGQFARFWTASKPSTSGACTVTRWRRTGTGPQPRS